MTRSINLVIECKKPMFMKDLKNLVAKKLDTYPCSFRMTNDKGIEYDLSSLNFLPDFKINDGDTLYVEYKSNVDKAVLEKWFKLVCFRYVQNQNWCSNLPLSEWGGVETDQEGKIIKLDLAKIHTHIVPPELSLLKDLKYLNLNGNKLTSVPSELSQLRNLEYLNLKNNKLTSIPSELSQLIKLKELYLSKNKLTSIPSELSQLKNLKILNLCNNKLSSIPSELSQLKNLKKLFLQRNNISLVPSGLSKLINLDICTLHC